MRTHKTEGIIIKRRNIGEADKILTVFSKDFGKMQAKAKGIRKITSKRSSSLDLLTTCRISFYKGPGMPLITEVEPVDSHPSIKKNLERVYTAYHMCELVDGLCAEEQENETVYALFGETLQKLGREKYLKELINDFEIQLLTRLGFWGKEQIENETNVQMYIESLLERKLRSKNIYSKLLS
jgi:DNA repair protein RecO (recombination protein O)